MATSYSQKTTRGDLFTVYGVRPIYQIVRKYKKHVSRIRRGNCRKRKTYELQNNVRENIYGACGEYITNVGEYGIAYEPLGNLRYFNLDSDLETSEFECIFNT